LISSNCDQVVKTLSEYEYDDVDCVRYAGSTDEKIAVQKAGAGNRRRTWVSVGAGALPNVDDVLRVAAQVKNFFGAVWSLSMFTFEWDDTKAASNLKKHRVSFDEAVTVFGDMGAITFADVTHSDAEDRSRTYGVSANRQLPVVIHTERKTSVRIISARKAKKYEKNIYEQG
jgi:uncharacterized protein